MFEEENSNLKEDSMLKEVGHDDSNVGDDNHKLE